MDPEGAKRKKSPKNKYDYETHAGIHSKPINGRMPINSCYAGKVMPSSQFPKELQKKYPHGIPFNMFGFPDFSRYAEKNVDIGEFISDDSDFRRANTIAYGDKNPHGKKAPDGFTWHHTTNGGNIQLIPQDLHDFVKHTGGAAKCGTRK